VLVVLQLLLENELTYLELPLLDDVHELGRVSLLEEQLVPLVVAHLEVVPHLDEGSLVHVAELEHISHEFQVALHLLLEHAILDSLEGPLREDHQVDIALADCHVLRLVGLVFGASHEISTEYSSALLGVDGELILVLHVSLSSPHD